MNNKIGIAAIIFAVAAVIMAVGTAVVNFMTLKWTVKIYEPFDRLFKRSEPLLNKYIEYGEKSLDDLVKPKKDED